MIRFYSKLLQAYPSTTKISTTGILFWLGDVAAQTIQIYKLKTQNNYSFKRNLTFFGFGQCLAGPLFLLYYGKIQPFLLPGNAAATIGKKLLLDQLIWAPFVTSFIFFTLTLLEGKRAQDGIDKVRNMLWSTLCVNWSVWPFVMGANFYIIPVKYHIAVVNIAGFFWNTFISYTSNKKLDK